METLDRAEARKLWSQYWRDMKKEWFKIEVLQDYTGEDDCPSLQAWIKGDKKQSLRLLQQSTHNNSWLEQCQKKSRQGVLMRRIRILEEPLTPYTEWELEFYKFINIPGGEQIFMLDGPAIEGLDLPSGDVMMFDDRRVVVCAYDHTGRMVQQSFYDENDDISKFLQLKHSLLARAQ